MGEGNGADIVLIESSDDGCRYDSAEIKELSVNVARLSRAIEGHALTQSSTEARLLLSISQLTCAIQDIRKDVLPAAIGRDQVPLKVFYASIASVIVATLGVAVVKQFLEIA